MFRVRGFFNSFLFSEQNGTEYLVFCRKLEIEIYVLVRESSNKHKYLISLYETSSLMLMLCNIMCQASFQHYGKIIVNSSGPCYNFVCL